MGDPADEKTEVGSLVSQKQRERVLDYIAVGREEGAELVYGGAAARRGRCSTRVPS